MTHRHHFYVNVSWVWKIKTPWASCQIRKITGYSYAGNARNIFPDTDFNWNHWLAIRACNMCTCRDASLTPSRHSRRMRNPQCYVSGKRPITGISQKCIDKACIKYQNNDVATKLPFWVVTSHTNYGIAGDFRRQDTIVFYDLISVNFS